jgi:putative copper resistance protein D
LLSDPLIAARAVHFASTVLLVGTIVFGCLVAEPAFGSTGAGSSQNKFRRQLAWIAWIALATAVVSGAAWLILLAAEISGRPLAEVFRENVVWTVLTRTRFGADWSVRIVLAILLAGALIAFARNGEAVAGWRGAVLATIAAAFFGSLAWAGHAAATRGLVGDLHLAADALHLVAAGAWLGGLLPLTLLLAAARGAGGPAIAVARDATRRFSALGIVSVATILGTGCVNTWLLAGSVPALAGTDYGRLLLLKIGLFIAMVAVAGFNRGRLTPRLASPQGSDDALRRLRRNALVEAALGLAILGIVGVLGTLPPGLHAQPVWPFTVRLSDRAFADPELRATLFSSIGGCAVGLLAVAMGIRLQRLRWPMILVGCLVTAFSAPGLRALTEEAFPTSYWASPTGYSVQSIAEGKALYDRLCAPCHGATAHGDGPGGVHLKKRPADLTADHLYSHSDGDLFWWISTGIDDAMPGFGGAVDETGRWNLVDFLRANADGIRVGRSAGRTIDVGYPVPSFSAQCADGTSSSTDELHGRIVHIVFAGPESDERLAQLAQLDPGNDVTTIVVAPGRGATKPGRSCVARNADVATAFTLFRGAKPALTESAEFLVDTEGNVRSSWYPGMIPDWRQTDVLKTRIDEIRRRPVASSSRAAHAHLHR